ncbi:MAG: 23S rRNA (adenine(2503)-C(2))-methyltransferase RlmN, partial [Desulfovibrionaceae bacterium]|nr:23S rRNA (adenine(2503)-C(2))-methyltransferase RlmN [Desulfovibrionaceae bacterium]
MIDILNKTYDELILYVESLGEKPFRGKQLWHWLWNKRVRAFDEMHTLSRAFRETLSRAAQIIYPTIVKREQSSDGTIKMALSF